MTPKEKAAELFNEYYFLIQYPTQMWKQKSKQCALILINAMIVQIYNIDHQHRAIYNPETGYYSYTDSNELLFWKEVKQEIEKL